MPNILFASNNVGHFPTLAAGFTDGTYDATRVPYSFALTAYQTVNSPVFIPTTGDETWFHFVCCPLSNDTNPTYPFFAAYDDDDHLLFNITKTPLTSAYLHTGTLYNGSTTTTIDGIVPMTPGKLNFIDIKYTSTALLLRVDFYVNGGLSLTRNFAANPNGYGHPVKFSLSTGFAINSAGICHVSELLVADGDTRNARFNLLRPSASGAYTDWAGSLATLVDDDMTTGMTTLLAGDRVTTQLSEYDGAPNISNVVVVSSTTRGENSPTGLKHTIRLSTVDYDGDLIPLDFPLQYNITDFKLNPATSLPWVSSDLSSIETGFLSVA